MEAKLVSPGWLSPRAALAAFLGWFGLSVALVAASGTHVAAAFFALALGLLAIVCLRGRLALSLAAAGLLALAFAACQLVTAAQPVGVTAGLYGTLADAAGAARFGQATWGPALLGGALLLLTVPVAGLPGSRFR